MNRSGYQPLWGEYPIAIGMLILENAFSPMKTNKSTQPANSRTSAKVPQKAKVSLRVKTSPSVKNSPGPKATPRTNGVQNPNALLPGTVAPQDDATQPVTHLADAIRARAYLNYQKRGSEDGYHTDDWLRAEAELIAEQQLVRA